MANVGNTYAAGADPSPQSGTAQPRGPVVMPPAPPTVATQPSVPSFQPDANMSAQPPQPMAPQPSAPSFQPQQQMPPSSFTTSFAPESISNPAAREEFAPQIAQDIEQNRNAAQAGFRNQGLQLREQEEQQRIKQAQDKADQQAAATKALMDAKNQGIRTFKAPDGTEQVMTQNGKPVYQPITEKDAAPAQFDDKGTYIDDTGKQFTGTPGAAVKITMDSAGNRTAVDPDRNVKPEPFTDDNGKDWVLKANKYNPYQYIDPVQAITDPKLQQTAAKVMWGSASAKATGALQDVNNGIATSEQALRDNKILDPDTKPMAVKQALSDKLADFQDTLKDGPPKPQPAAFPGFSDRPPDKDAVDAYNEATVGLPLVQKHLEMLDQRQTLGEQAKTLKALGPAGYLQQYLQGKKKNDVGPESADTSGSAVPANLTVSPQATAQTPILPAVPPSGSPSSPSGPAQTPNNSGPAAPSSTPIPPSETKAVAGPDASPTLYSQTIGALANSYKQGVAERKFETDNDAPTRAALLEKQFKSGGGNPQDSSGNSYLSQPFKFIGGLASDWKHVAVGTIEGGAGGLLGGPFSEATVPGGALVGGRVAMGIDEGLKAKAETTTETYNRLRQQEVDPQDAFKRAEMTGNLSGAGAFAVNAFLPGGKGFGSGLKYAASKVATGAGQFAAANAVTAGLTTAAQRQAGVQFNPGEQTKQILDSAKQGAEMGVVMEGAHALVDQYGQHNIAQDVNQNGANAKFVQRTAAQFASLDASKLSADKVAQAKEAILQPLSPTLRPIVQDHINTVLDATNQISDSQKAAIAHLPPANPKLTGLSDAQLSARAAAVPHPSDPLQVNPQDVQAEIQRRADVRDALAKNQPVVDSIIAQANVKSEKTRTMSQMPDGMAMLDGVNRFNATRPEGTPAADLATAHLASDLSPKTDPDAVIQPHALSYLGIGHEVENLPDPKDKDFAQTALKILNGRAIDGTAEKSLVGSDGKNPELPQHIGPSGMPLARKDPKGNLILTDEGLDRLRQLVPASKEMLSQNGSPITSQHLAETAGKVEKKIVPRSQEGKNSGLKPQKVTSKTDSPKTNNSKIVPRVPHLANLDDNLLKTRLANLQSGRERLQKTSEAAKARGVSVPAGHEAQLARHDRAIAEHEQETAARAAQRKGPPKDEGFTEGGKSETGKPVTLTMEDAERNQMANETHPARPAEGDHEGDVIKYHHPDGTIHEGEVASVHPDHYRVFGDAESTMPVPFSHVLPKEPDVQAETRPGDSARPVSENQPAAEKGVESGDAPKQEPLPESSPAAEHLPGIPRDVAAAHPEAASILSKTVKGMSDLLKAVGVDPADIFARASHPEGTIGLAVHSKDLAHIQLDLPRLAENLARLKTPEERQVRVEAVMGEEVIHLAAEKVLGAESDAAHAKIWSSLTDEQKQAVIDHYGDRLGAKDATDSLRGKEAVRMMVQLERDGKITELAQTGISQNPEVRSLFQKIVDYLKSVLKPNDEATKDLIARINRILDAKTEGNEGPAGRVEKPEPEAKPTEIKQASKPTAQTLLEKSLKDWTPAKEFEGKTDKGLEAMKFALKARIKKAGDHPKNEDEKLLARVSDELYYREQVKRLAVMKGLPSDEEIKAQDEARREAEEPLGDRVSLIDAVKKAGGITTTDPTLQGELENLKQSKNRGTMMNLFRKSGKKLDQLREALSEQGFHFDHITDMLDAIQKSVSSGTEVYGKIKDTGTGDMFAEKPVESGPAEIKIPSQEKALEIYNRLSAIRKEKGTLTASQSAMLEAAEKKMGQKFVPGFDETEGKPPEKEAAGAQKSAPKSAEKQQALFDTGHDIAKGQQTMFGAEVPRGQDGLDRVHSTYERDGHTDQLSRIGSRSLSEDEASFQRSGSPPRSDEPNAGERLSGTRESDEGHAAASRRDLGLAKEALRTPLDHGKLTHSLYRVVTDSDFGSEGQVLSVQPEGSAYKLYHPDTEIAHGLQIDSLNQGEDGKLRIETRRGHSPEELAANLDAFKQIPDFSPFEVHGTTNKGVKVIKMPHLEGEGTDKALSDWVEDAGAVPLNDSAKAIGVNSARAGDNYVVQGKDGKPYLLADVSPRNLRIDGKGKPWLVDAIPHEVTSDELANHPALKTAYEKAADLSRNRQDQPESARGTKEGAPGTTSSEPGRILGASEKKPGDRPAAFGAEIKDEDKPIPETATPEAREISKQSLGMTDRIASKVPQDLKNAAKMLHEATDSVVKMWAPDKRSESAAFTGRSLSAHIAEMDASKVQADHALREASAFFDRRTENQNLPALFALDEGTQTGDKTIDDFNQAMRQMNISRRDALRSMPNSHFKAFLVNYLPHIFVPEDLAAAQSFFESKIEGSRSFLKHRTIPTLREALEWTKPDGTHLRLVSYNPAELYQIRWGQMDKYIAGQKMLKDMIDAGIAHKFEKASEIPAGNKQIDDRIGLSTEPLEAKQEAYTRPNATDPKGNKANYKTIHYYAPESAVQILENHLSKGLRDGPVYKVLTGVANTMNQFQLGFSAFHLGFTTLDMGVSKLAYGLEEAAHGNIGASLKAVASIPKQLASPLHLLAGYASPKLDTHIGSLISKEMDMPGSQGAEIAALANAVIQGGGGNKMDPAYANQMVKSFTKAWRQGNKFGAAWRAPLAAVEAASRPIMEYLVPRQKLAVFADLAKMEMKKLGPDATADDMRKAYGKAWNSVDNRMGQLRYDNLYWNKTAKDLAMIATRSVGWNLGSYRELLGGLADYGKAGAKILSGNPKEAEFTHKMAYTLALPMMVGSLGAMINYLYTGEAPQNDKDYFFPRTGEKDGSGHNVRLALPSYMKDVYAFKHDPAQTLVNKANPIFSMLGSLWQNKDFYGTEIRHPDDNYLQQGAEALGFVAKSFEPFAVSGGSRLHQQGASAAKTALPFVGITPAPSYIDKTPAEQKAEDIRQEESPPGTKTEEQFEKQQARSQLMQNLQKNDPTKGGSSAKFGELLRQAVESKTISRSEVAETVKKMRMSPLEREFHSMTYSDAARVWSVASPKEKEKLLPLFRAKMERQRLEGNTVDGSLLKLAN